MSEFHFQPIKGKAREILKAILQTPEVSSCSLKVGFVLRKSDHRIVIRFKDGGIPFNPLERPKPDTKLHWKQRRIGGLGIFLVIKKMDAVRYAYEDNHNVLTIEKNI